MKSLWIVILLSQFLSFCALAAIPYRLTIEDPKNALSSNKDLVLKNFDAAISDWAKFISSKGELWIHLRVTNQTPRLQGGSIGYKELSVENGKRIFEFSASYKMRTGEAVNVNQPDILILLNPNVFQTSLEIDPNPQVRINAIPRGKLDLVSAFIHELGHGFGIQGFLDYTSIKSTSGDVISVYDSFIEFNNSELAFNGPQAKAANNNQPVPLTYCKGDYVQQIIRNGKDLYLSTDGGQNIYHLGQCHSYENTPDRILFSVMGGVWPFESAASGNGLREYVTKQEASILWDIGIPVAHQ